jgi:hypothetical protein
MLLRSGRTTGHVELQKVIEKEKVNDRSLDEDVQHTIFLCSEISKIVEAYEKDNSSLLKRIVSFRKMFTLVKDNYDYFKHYCKKDIRFKVVIMLKIYQWKKLVPDVSKWNPDVPKGSTDEWVKFFKKWAKFFKNPVIIDEIKATYAIVNEISEIFKSS